MTGISVSRSTKDEFDDLKPDDSTHDDFMQELLSTYRNRDEKVVIDTDEIVTEISHQVVSEVELASYRGVVDAYTEHLQNDA